MSRNTPARTPALSEQLAARAPHYKSFDHITDPVARRAKEIEQHLLFLAEVAPEIARDLQPLINNAHRRGDAGRVSARDLILEAMTKTLPPGTLEEFVEDLELPYGTVRENLMKLAEAGLVVIGMKPREVEPAGKRGGARKAEAVFTLAH
jgi:predicted transcriptional regulator